MNKSVVAFANTNGGTLYLGIADDGGVVGVQNADSALIAVSDSIRDAIKPDVTPLTDCRTEEMAGKTVIKIVVQKGAASPYYLASEGIRPEGVYVRQGAFSVPASKTVILRMMKDTDGENYEDVRSLNQDLTFAEAAKEFETRNAPFGTGQQKTLGIMKMDGIYTNLGLLLSDQCVHTVKLAVFQGTTKSLFKDRREFSGSSLKQLSDVYAYIDRYNGVRSEIIGLHRKDTRDYTVDAVREAILNALVHRDYSFSDSTLISIFDDRIEFVSIGGLVKGISFDDIMLGASVFRNRNLANIFYRLMLIEAYGTGVPKIIRSYDGFSVKPQIKATDNAFKITLPNINAATKISALTANERAVLELFKDRRQVVRKDVETALSGSQASASRALKGLVDKGEIRVVGQGKNTRYVAT
ncbi:MAG: putative DNA binding domain-containing protein [Deltaproteobacteria bacterium]|nr:putative DNA binding domain-containing protein [Deltaproteobacteria bacterium]